MRRINWLKAAWKTYQRFPQGVIDDYDMALALVAGGHMPRSVKPLRGLGAGVHEIVANDRAGTFRVIYVLEVEDEVVVIHAFQKKSKRGIETPKSELDVVRERLKRIRGQA